MSNYLENLSKKRAKSLHVKSMVIYLVEHVDIR